MKPKSKQLELFDPFFSSVMNRIPRVNWYVLDFYGKTENTHLSELLGTKYWTAY